MLGSLFSKIAGPKATNNFIKKETPTQVFFFKYCEIFKNTYFEEHLRRAASGNLVLNGSDTNFTDRILFFTNGNLSLSNNVVCILNRNSIYFKQRSKRIINDMIRT